MSLDPFCRQVARSPRPLDLLNLQCVECLTVGLVLEVEVQGETITITSNLQNNNNNFAMRPLLKKERAILRSLTSLTVHVSVNTRKYQK